MRLTLTTALALALLSSLIPGGNRGVADDGAGPKPAPAPNPAGPPSAEDSTAR